MPEANYSEEQTVRDRAYYIWEHEGRPEGRAREHWHRAVSEESHDEPMLEEEKILAGNIDVNMPALLTRDVQGG